MTNSFKDKASIIQHFPSKETWGLQWLPEKELTESYKEYPAGRGKRLVITVKRSPKKPRKTKNPRFCHARVKSNPNNITVTEYINNQDARKQIYIFPEGRKLGIEERRELALSLLITIPSILGRGDSMKFPVFLSKEDRRILKSKWRRYLKWREEH